MQARPATLADCPAIARIYNEGIEDRVATFETDSRSPDDVAAWFDGFHPTVVVEDGGEVIAFASTSTYRPRACYKGVAEFSVYVARQHRGREAGRTAMSALIAAAKDAGFWKLVSRVFPENVGSLRLLRSLGFRQIGTYYNHAQLDGNWRNVVIVERLLKSELTLEAPVEEPQLHGKVVQPGKGEKLNAFPDFVLPILTAADTGGAYAVLEQSSQPGNGTPLHRHQREDESFYVLEGDYEFTVGDQMIQAGPGTYLFGPRRIPHKFRCVGTTAGRVQIMIAPAGFEKFFVELNRLATGGAPKAQDLVALARKYEIEFIGSQSTWP
jgi:L-amino acid N-acyltransferase YncA/quercetin dioxygenase-like cupin family protein